MDDFGSGYSSLNMLKDLSIDTLKVDRAFLEEAADNEKRNIIFVSVVEMARKLNISLVVEGVETGENVSLMRECGCNIAQGYYFARPMEKVNLPSFSGRVSYAEKNRMYYGGCGNFYTGCGLQQRASETQAGSFFWCWWATRWVKEKQFMEDRAKELGADITVRFNTTVHLRHGVKTVLNLLTAASMY